jgi:hypothetical protein
MPKTILEIFGLTKVKEGRYSAYPVADKPKNDKLFFGVELEIENLDDERSLNSYAVPGISIKEDGSLRGYNAEFVTAPVNRATLAQLLEAFYKRGQFTEKNFTERCSAHVHMNVQDVTFEDLNCLFMLYQVFERVLFAFVGDERDKNIFCVPWHDTSITAGAVFCSVDPQVCAAKWMQWEKYTALNLTRMRDLGTIEFRHLAGQVDYTKILVWCDILAAMLLYAQTVNKDALRERILSLNTSSEYRKFFAEVFRDVPLFLGQALSTITLERDMEHGVMALKYNVAREMKAVVDTRKPKPARGSKFYDIWAQGAPLPTTGNAVNPIPVNTQTILPPAAAHVFNNEWVANTIAQIQAQQNNG